MAPEAIAFAAIGLGNLVLYFLIFNALLFIGAVKSTIIATLVTTYLAYLANRHWTYKDRPRRTVRREYTMFFAVNMVGLLIQAAGNGILKYGFGIPERGHQLAFNAASALCICIATVFRFWTYRTFVFKEAPPEPATTAAPPGGPRTPQPATAEQPAPVSELPVVAPAEGVPVNVPSRREPVTDQDGQAASEEEFQQLAAELAADLRATEKPGKGTARIH
jgi:putative flippase GtrA